MALSFEKERLTKEIDRYLTSKRDAGKKVIANNCKASIALALNHRELLAALEAYRAELLRLVDKKNAKRWFKHKPGELDKILEKGIERIRIYAANERRIFSVDKPNQDLTVRDWNRHRDGKAYVVNGRPFTGSISSIDELDGFLRSAGIQRARLREYLCDYANQDGLFSAGHLFVGICGRRDVHMSFAGMRHVYRKGRNLSQLHCRDEAWFNAAIYEGATYPLEPVLKFVQLYDLVENNGEVSIVESRYELENLESLPEGAQDLVRFALGSMNIDF